MIHNKLELIRKQNTIGKVYFVKGAEHVIVACAGGEMAARNNGRQIFRCDDTFEGIQQMHEFLSEHLCFVLDSL